MTSVIPLAEKCFFREAEVAEIDAYHLLGQDLLLKSFDLMTVTGEELREFSVPFSFLSYQINELTGFCIWFDVKFETRQMTESIKSGRTDVRPVVLSTSPYEEPTHWMQTLLHIPATVSLFQDDPITGTIVVRSNPIHVNRKMLFSLSLDLYSFEEKSVKEEDKAEIVKLMKKGRQNKYAALGKLDERIARWTVEMKVGKKGKKQAALNTKYNWTPGGVSKKEIEPPPALTTKCGSLQFDFELE
ncbi:hypothetical protein BLNAU_14274 [Blattamonas nauphoetae]|uniref:Protein arginine N-methyltransferase domain-containing protein n=1 Tax=Blattamonas nauphoetae TaxID=2049346 RepID=A0ABQ9XHS2_9EUKA|nr:hypothetical protein BLNAU_14274 [Blattamonas nauphoetae]